MQLCGSSAFIQDASEVLLVFHTQKTNDCAPQDCEQTPATTNAWGARGRKSDVKDAR